MCERRLDEWRKPEQTVNMGEVERGSDKKTNNFISDWKINPNVCIKSESYHFPDLSVLFSSSKTDTFFLNPKGQRKNYFTSWGTVFFGLSWVKKMFLVIKAKMLVWLKSATAVWCQIITHHNLSF